MQVCRAMTRRVRRRCLLVVLGSEELRRSRRTMWRLLEADSNVHPRRRRRRRPTRSNNRDQSVSAARVVAAQWLLSRQCRVQPDPLAQPLCPCCCCRCEAGGRDCCCLFVVLRYSASMTTLGPDAGTPPQLLLLLVVVGCRHPSEPLTRFCWKRNKDCLHRHI